MFARSFLALRAIVGPRNLMNGPGQARTLFASQSLKNQENSSSGNDDKHIWVEDYLRLDIKDNGKETVVDTILTETGRESKLIPAEKAHRSTACVLCRLNVRNLNYTDVMILSQFIKKNGNLVTYHESKLCSKQYKLVERLIKKAQRCNLIPRPADYLVPGPWHDLNTYLEPDRQRDQPMKVIKKEYWRI